MLCVSSKFSGEARAAEGFRLETLLGDLARDTRSVRVAAGLEPVGDGCARKAHRSGKVEETLIRSVSRFPSLLIGWCQLVVQLNCTRAHTFVGCDVRWHSPSSRHLVLCSSSVASPWRRGAVFGLCCQSGRVLRRIRISSFHCVVVAAMSILIDLWLKHTKHKYCLLYPLYQE